MFANFNILFYFKMKRYSRSTRMFEIARPSMLCAISFSPWIAMLARFCSQFIAYSYIHTPNTTIADAGFDGLILAGGLRRSVA